jgi:uncharacterized damage-inducible protein DinB
MPRPDELTNLLESLTRYRAVTQRMLDLVPPDRLAWRPAEGARTFAETFLHIAGAESWYVRGLLTGTWDRETISPPGDAANRNSIAANLSTSRAATRVLLQGLRPAALAAPAEVPGEDRGWCVAQWLWFVLEHEIHHQGQLATCLRLLGISSPSFGG